MLKQFDELVKQRDQLKRWWAMKNEIARYDKTTHTLRVDVVKPSMVAFCGQQYAGAKNYHDAPTFFVEAIRKQFSEHSRELTAKAYEAEMSRLDELIESQRESVLAELGKA